MDGSLISLGLAKVLEISRPKKTLLDDLQLIREDILLIARIFHRKYIGKCPSVSYVKPSNGVFWVMHCTFVVVNYLRALETSSRRGCSHFPSPLRGLEKKLRK